jgi:hypothetical protein
MMDVLNAGIVLQLFLHPVMRTQAENRCLSDSAYGSATATTRRVNNASEA